MLNPKKVKLEINEFGKLVLEVNDKEYEDFRALKLFPLSKSDQYVSFYEKNEGEIDKLKNEIGILKDFRELDEHSWELLEMELEKSYFMPEITRIDNVERVEGNWKWQVDTNRGLREFTVRSRTRDIRKLDNGNIVIKDADRNRFKISINALDQDSIAILLKQI